MILRLFCLFHENHIERRKIVQILPLPSVNIMLKDLVKIMNMTRIWLIKCKNIQIISFAQAQSGSSTQNHYINFMPQSFNSNNGQGRGRGHGKWSNNISQCQLCGRLGHLVVIYWHRFDKNFVLPNTNQQAFLSTLVSLPLYEMD